MKKYIIQGHNTTKNKLYKTKNIEAREITYVFLVCPKR